jgi:type IV secretion system protein VirB3
MSAETQASEEPGLEVPLHRSLLEPMLMAGLPRTFAIVFWTTTVALALGLHELWVLPISFGFHIVCANAVKTDPHFFTVLFNSVRSQRRLLP